MRAFTNYKERLDVGGHQVIQLLSLIPDSLIVRESDPTVFSYEGQPFGVWHVVRLEVLVVSLYP